MSVVLKAAGPKVGASLGRGRKVAGRRGGVSGIGATIGMMAGASRGTAGMNVMTIATNADGRTSY